MRRIVMNTLLAVVLAGGVAAAQYPASPQSGSKGAKSGQAKGSQSQNVTLTGCIQASDQGTSGTSGTAGKTAKPSDHFMLTNVSSTSGTGAAGTSGTAGTAGTAGDVMLMGKGLKAHTGHKVQVTGKWESGTGTKAGSTGASASGQTLHVASIKMISESCSGQ